MKRESAPANRGAFALLIRTEPEACRRETVACWNNTGRRKSKVPLQQHVNQTFCRTRRGRKWDRWWLELGRDRLEQAVQNGRPVYGRAGVLDSAFGAAGEEAEAVPGGCAPMQASP